MTGSTHVWSASTQNPFLTERSMRGRNVTPAAQAVLDTDVEGLASRGAGIHFVTGGKKRAAKRPFSRTQTHVIESWTGRVGDDEIVFNAPSAHELRHANELPRLLA